MTQYLISIHQPVGPPPAPEVMERVGAGLHALNEDIKAAGSWVFTGGLTQPDLATVVRQSGGQSVTTDGPYVEAKEHLGGLWIVDAPDLDTVLGWARRASEATTLPIEVRPFQGGPEY